MSDGQLISQPLEQKSTLQAEFPPISEVNTNHAAENTSLGFPEIRIILVMEMREGKIYPMLVLEGGSLHDNIFGKHINLQGVYVQSLSAFPYPQTTSSQGCCSMTCYWLISEIGIFFSACNGNFWRRSHPIHRFPRLFVCLLAFLSVPVRIKQ